jgi:hypothetical protein
MTWKVYEEATARYRRLRKPLSDSARAHLERRKKARPKGDKPVRPGPGREETGSRFEGAQAHTIDGKSVIIPLP